MSRGPVTGAVRDRVPQHAPGSSAPVLLLIALDLVLAAWVTTQYLARRLSASPALGPWLNGAPPPAARWWRAGAVLLAGGALALALVVRARRGSYRRWWLALGLAGVLAAGIAATEARRGPLRFVGEDFSVAEPGTVVDGHVRG